MMLLSDTILFCLLILWAVYASHRWLKFTLSARIIPPGPQPRWLIGNLFDIPIQEGWLIFTEWKQRYGDIVSVRALGNTMVVLNSLEAISSLLDKRGGKFSYRPRLVMAGEVIGLDRTTPLIQYGDTWRKHRKLAHVALSPQAVNKYHHMQERVAQMYLQSLLSNPEDFVAQLRLTTGKIVMAMAYGLTVDNADNEYIIEAEHTLQVVGRAMVPGTYLMDLLPILKHVPAWIPFITFAKEGVEGRKLIDSFISRPFEHVRREIAEGKACPSFALDTMNSIERGELAADIDEETVKWAAGSLYGAGGETTYSVVLTFMLAMALYPDIQRRAQAEIDRVVGSERIPTLKDSTELPYVAAVISESLRWHVAVPLGIAHRSVEDSIFKGYHIKAGSIIIPNVWAISRDTKNYDSPKEFIPERFLDMENTNILDPRMYAFGFGRRICPGRHLAENSLFALISSILSTFTISKKLDKYGTEMPLKYKFTKGLISYPEAFECHIVPRSPKVVQLIKAEALEEGTLSAVQA